MMKAEQHHDEDWGGGEVPRLTRFLSGGEDPTTWSVPLYRLGSLRVRAHWVWIVGLVLGLLLSLSVNRLGTVHVLTAMGWGIVLVLAREHFRHLVSGAGKSGESLAVLWDFGCMNLPEVDGAPRRPRLHAVGGVVFNLLLLPVTAGVVVWLGGGRDALLFNPTKLQAVVGGLASPKLAAAWWLYSVNLMVLGANLLPMLPMDAGRAMVAWREREIGREVAVLRAARLGLWVAGATLVAAVAVGSEKLAAMALVGGFVCWMQTSRAKLLGISGGPEARLDQESWMPSEAQERAFEATAPRPWNAKVATPAEEEDDTEEVDRILAKISRDGMASLSGRERKTLERATKRRRDGQNP